VRSSLGIDRAVVRVQLIVTLPDACKLIDRGMRDMDSVASIHALCFGARLSKQDWPMAKFAGRAKPSMIVVWPPSKTAPQPRVGTACRFCNGTTD